MSEDSEFMGRIAKANEEVAASTQNKLKAEMVNAQVSLERSLRTAALAAATALSAIHKYERREQVIEAAEDFLAWLRGGTNEKA